MKIISISALLAACIAGSSAFAAGNAPSEVLSYARSIDACGPDAYEIAAKLRPNGRIAVTCGDPAVAVVGAGGGAAGAAPLLGGLGPALGIAAAAGVLAAAAGGSSTSDTQ